MAINADRMAKLPDEYEGAIKNTVTSVDHLRLAARNMDLDGEEQPEEVEQALATLEEGFKHLVWADPDPSDIGQKAEPFWDRDEEMPQFVERAIREALRAGAIQRISEELPTGTTRTDVESFFREQLDQPQGWSLRSLSENYAERFGVDPEDAINAVRTQTANVLNEAREQGYRQQGNIDDRVFAWTGPSDQRTTDECEWLKEQTNPRFGGEPVTLDELKTLVQRARNGDVSGLDGYSDYDGAEWSVHWQERHTYTEQFPD